MKLQCDGEGQTSTATYVYSTTVSLDVDAALPVAAAQLLLTNGLNSLIGINNRFDFAVIALGRESAACTVLVAYERVQLLRLIELRTRSVT